MIIELINDNNMKMNMMKWYSGIMQEVEIVREVCNSGLTLKKNQNAFN